MGRPIYMKLPTHSAPNSHHHMNKERQPTNESGDKDSVGNVFVVLRS